MKKVYLLLTLIAFQSISAQMFKKSEPFTHTYSIVARDSVTGDMGVAVQSHWFNVGGIVTYGQAGVVARCCWWVVCCRGVLRYSAGCVIQGVRKAYF